MNFALEARQLADYIQSLDFYGAHPPRSNQVYTHIGALYTNIVLQAGLNYKTVVFPRVHRVLSLYPEAETVRGFMGVIKNNGLENVIKWRHEDKLRRLHHVLEFSVSHSIDSCLDLTEFLKNESNHERFLEIKGFGNKTLDYTLKLLNFDTIAVDRHIYSFVEQAGLPMVDYKSTKKIVEFAADLLKVSRASIDDSIWAYMSSKSLANKRDQIPINF